MSPLRQSLENYLKIRRLLGAKLTSTAYELGRFVTFLEQERAPYITTSLALRWLRKSDHIQAAVANQRLGIIRVFATWLHATDARTEIPPQGLLPGYFQRTRPYIYRDEEVVQILEATRELRPRDGLRPLTYATLFGLLAVTGMRSTEAVSLDREDVDLVDGILTVRESKFGKTRWLPFHESTRDALRAYASRRDQFVPAPRDAGFFLSDAGTRILGCSARYTFAMLSQAIGLRQRTPSSKNGRNHGHGPRLHDLRHRFAVRTLVDWYRTVSR